MPLTPLTVQMVEVREVEPPAPALDFADHAGGGLCGGCLPDRTLVHLPLVVERLHYLLKSGGGHFEDDQRRSVMPYTVYWRCVHRWPGACCG
ncbi:MAG: hypothetical protein L0154_16510 [Chloroflexi bacterium]|nr:hypothetical protein [Chloroflexota bacterium]